MPAVARHEVVTPHLDWTRDAVAQPYPTEFDHFSSYYDELLQDPICDKFAGSGRLYFHLRKRDVIQHYFRRIGRDTRRLSYLDVGCGRGELLMLMHSDFGRVCGCDPSEGMISAGGLAHDRIEIRLQESTTALPYDNSEFDFVTAVCVYHHVPPEQWRRITAELARVLRPGGVACVIEHNPINPVTRLIVSRSPVDAGAVLLPAAETSNLFQKQGFRVDRREYFLYLPKCLYRAFHRIERSLSGVPLGGQYAMFAVRPC
jgi:SAM-dependent methyltransferase